MEHPWGITIFCFFLSFPVFLVSSATGEDLPKPAASPTPPSTQAFAGPHREFVKSLKPLPNIQLAQSPHLMGPEEVESGPLLVSLDDLSAVSVLGADGKVRLARAGDGLEQGDSFQTGEKGSARVAFEKGVQVLMPPGAIVHLGQESLAGPGGGLDVPMVELEAGEVRILVESAPKTDVENDNDKGPRPLKLLVRTKAAVMGVRGTDFMISAVESKTVLQMVSGTVEVAVDSHALGLGQVIRVAASESAEIVRGRPLPLPEHYEAGMELKEFHNRHPRLEAIWNSAVRDAKTRRLQPRFLELRTHKVDALNLKNGYPPAAVRAESKRLDDEAKKWKLREAGQQDEEGLNTRKKHRKRHRKIPNPAEEPEEVEQ